MAQKYRIATKMLNTRIPIEIPDTLTPLTVDGLLVGFHHAWCELMGGPPTNTASIELVTGHVKAETGFKYCHNYAIGNKKSSEDDGLDYQYYACNEILLASHADKLVRSDPKHVVITERRSDGKCITWFYPKHRGCRFAAFGNQEEACVHHLSFLMRRTDVWTALVHADPIAYSHALASCTYYTQDEKAYTETLLGCLRDIQRRKFDWETLPVFGVHDKERIRGLIGVIQNTNINGDITPIG